MFAELNRNLPVPNGSGGLQHGPAGPPELLYLRCCRHIRYLRSPGKSQFFKRFKNHSLSQVTHFVAWFSLDQRRQDAHRDGCLCCYTHKNFEVSRRLELLSMFVQAFEFSKVNLLNTAFRAIGELIVTRWFQVGHHLSTAHHITFLIPKLLLTS